MNKTLAQKIQSSKYFQAIKKADEKITKAIFGNVSEETKARVVANVEKAGSRAYKIEKAHMAIVEEVFEGMLEDPYWREVIAECAANQ